MIQKHFVKIINFMGINFDLKIVKSINIEIL